MRLLPWLIVLTSGLAAGPARAGSFCAGDRARLGQRVEATLVGLDRALEVAVTSSSAGLVRLRHQGLRLLLWAEFLESRRALLSLLSSSAPPDPTALAAVASPWARADDVHRGLGGPAAPGAEEEARFAALQAQRTLAVCRALSTEGAAACVPLARVQPAAARGCAFLASQTRLQTGCRTAAIQALIALRAWLARGCAALGGGADRACQSWLSWFASWQLDLCAALARGDPSACQAAGVPPHRAARCATAFALDRFLRGALPEEQLPAGLSDALLRPALRAARAPGADCAQAALRVFDELAAPRFSLRRVGFTPPLPGLW